MLKLIRYYRPYIVAILAAVALLFVQANMDLALPDYLSRIVNVGIQQGGIDSVFPESLSSQTYGALTQIMASNTREFLPELYSPASSSNGESYLLVSGSIDELNSSQPSVENDFALSLLLVHGEALSGVLGGRTADGESPMAGLALDPSQVMQMAPEQRIQAFVQIKGAMAASLEPMVLEQLGIAAATEELRSQGKDLDAIRANYIFSNGAIMVGLTALSALATILVGYIAAKVSTGMATTLRRDLFTTVENFSAAEFDTFSSASLITRSTNDITQVQMVTFMVIRMVIYAPIMGIGGVIRAMGTAPSMAWIIALAVAVLLVIVGVVLVLAMPKFKAIQKLTDRLSKVAREQLSGIMVVRAFGRQGFEEERFDGANKDLTSTNLFVIRVMVTLMPVIMLVMNLLSVAIIYVGAQEIAASTMQVGDMMAFIQYAMQIVMSFLMLSMVFIFIPRASVSADRINQVLKTRATIVDPPEPKKMPKPVKGILEFKNVAFRYPGAEDLAIEGLSFVAKPGTMTAIIGSTGSGKSSAVSLIPRLYDVSEGIITLDGVDIRQLPQEDLRSHIGYVPQKATLFSGTIAENVAYGGVSGDDAIARAVSVAQADEFVSTQEAGLESTVNQGGANFSGGQKQRLSIARALAGDYPVLVLDDSFSALDFKTDRALRAALRAQRPEATLVVVAQRVATIMNAERIIVLDEGKVVGQGTHSELMADCTPYKEIANSQLQLEATNG